MRRADSANLLRAGVVRQAHVLGIRGELPNGKNSRSSSGRESTRQTSLGIDTSTKPRIQERDCLIRSDLLNIIFLIRAVEGRIYVVALLLLRILAFIVVAASSFAGAITFSQTFSPTIGGDFALGFTIVNQLGSSSISSQGFTSSNDISTASVIFSGYSFPAGSTITSANLEFTAQTAVDQPVSTSVSASSAGVYNSTPTCPVCFQCNCNQSGCSTCCVNIPCGPPSTSDSYNPASASFVLNSNAYILAINSTINSWSGAVPPQNVNLAGFASDLLAGNPITVTVARFSSYTDAVVDPGFNAITNFSGIVNLAALEQCLGLQVIAETPRDVPEPSSLTRVAGALIVFLSWARFRRRG